MSVNGWILNSDVVNGADSYESDVIDTGVGAICTIEQLVVISASGSICTIGQTVYKLETGVGSICEVSQRVINNYSREICRFVQIVTDGSSSFLTRNRWYVQVYLANQLIPDNMQRVS